MSDWFAPAYKAGGPIRSCVNFAFAMNDKYLICILTSNVDIDNIALEVNADEWIDLDTNIRIKYLSKSSQTNQNLQKILRNIQPSYVYLNSMFSPFFTLLPLYLLRLNEIKAKVIISTRGMLKDSAIENKKLKKSFFFLLLKGFRVVPKVSFHATDLQEKKDIIKRLGAKENSIATISNFPQSKQQIFRSILKTKNNLRLVYMSRLAPIKNLLQVLELFVHLNITKNQNIEFSVYGSLEDKIYWNKCLEIVKKLPSNIKIKYKGSINHEEVEIVLQENHFFILSTFGENFGHAIFESFAVGRPVIISDQTPWRGLEAKKIGWDIELNAQEKWIVAIEDAINMEQPEFDIWCQSSWQYAHDFIHDSGLKEKYLKLFSV
jgi:glycosyltransferase involved in cell wall biosynthesis